MLKQFEPLRNKIRDYATKGKDYAKAVQLSFYYLEEINKLTDISTQNDRNFIHYEIALNSKKQGKYETALKHALISLSYLEQEDFKGSRYANRLWLIGTCYTELGDYKAASRLYYKCSKIFRDMKEENQRAMIIFNNAKVMKNVKGMKHIIKIYETKTLNTVIVTYGDMEYDDILKSFYTELFEFYVMGNRQEAFNLLNNIRNKSLRKELLAKLIA